MPIAGNDDFFVLTKRIHNFLYGSSGDGGDLDDDASRVFDEVTEANATEFRELVKPEDVVVIHDPQLAGLLPAIRDIGCATVWRCHVGLDRPDPLARRALEFPGLLLTASWRAVWGIEGVVRCTTRPRLLSAP